MATETKESVPSPPPPPYDKNLVKMRWITIVGGMALITYLITLPKATYDTLDELNPNVPAIVDPNREVGQESRK